ncbi:MAG: hypothetical protein M3003_00915 [Candidatus Dormibacteraeota bacterium]|nr:hypothetical protein [Candidatus Dormibacteraeota bacterium]
MTDKTRAADDYREMLTQSTELLNEIRWGLSGYLDRIDEMTGSFGGGDGGGSSKGSVSDPTAAAATKRDPGRAELAQFRREVGTLYKAVLVLHARWRRGRDVQTAPPRLYDPGCELCSSLPATLPNGAPVEDRHWCGSYCTVTITTVRPKKRGKGSDTYTEELRVCYWCYRFHRRTDRRPNVSELAAHANGRRVMASA